MHNRASVWHADDSAFVSNNHAEMQHIVDRFTLAADMFSLWTNITKIELLYQSPPSVVGLDQPEEIQVHGELQNPSPTLAAVSTTNSADIEVECTIQSATKAYGALAKRLLNSHDILEETPR